jgi:glycerol-3-phosphate dehydrogenase
MIEQTIVTQVLIIGGGVTGTGLARDLALRGVECVLIEKKDINAGASGSNHGLLHSGARYVSNDPQSAIQCQTENQLLKRLVPDCIEETGGLFAAIAGDDERYIADFPGLCEKAGIVYRALDLREAQELEPNLSDSLVAAFAVEDATIDPFGLSLANIARAKSMGARFFLQTEVIGFKIKRGRIQAATVIDRENNRRFQIVSDQVVNAAGVWSGQVTAMAGIAVNMIYSKGTLLITNHRITGSVINRLRPPSDGDILVPGGTVSILGTTSSRIKSLVSYRPTVGEVDYIMDELSKVVPVLNKTRCIRAYAGVRPLIMQEHSGDDRSASREFELFDHDRDGIANFTTITGGKLTTFRYMSEKAADLVCQKMLLTTTCQTRQQPLQVASDSNWTYPGLSPKIWLRNQDQDDLLLCECEMVSKKMIDVVLSTSTRQNGQTDLKAIGLRSRLGKGSCQGSFCSIRLMAHLYNRKLLNQEQGKTSLKKFIQDRWIGQHVVLWGDQLAQAELSEAMHCGLFCLEV